MDFQPQERLERQENLVLLGLSFIVDMIVQRLARAT
jgi:hypothetical protein